MTRRRRALLIALAGLVVILVPLGVVIVPIITHQNAGLPGDQALTATSATSVGDDGRTREIQVTGGDLAALEPGDRLVVAGSGYDAARGIYVAICAIPDDATTKPGPCLGGIPEQEDGQEIEEGSVQYAASNWINDDWAWKLFGARGYDSREDGTFTAYLEVGEPVVEGLDCTVDDCAVFTRNDHTAANDRVQDLYLPVHFAAS